MTEFQLPQLDLQTNLPGRFYLEIETLSKGQASMGVFFEDVPRKHRFPAYHFAAQWFKREYSITTYATTGRGYSTMVERDELKPEHQKLYDKALAATLYEFLTLAAQDINNECPADGFYALRKVEHVSADSDLATLVKVGKDLELMTNKLQERMAGEGQSAAPYIECLPRTEFERLFAEEIQQAAIAGLAWAEDFAAELAGEITAEDDAFIAAQAKESTDWGYGW